MKYSQLNKNILASKSVALSKTKQKKLYNEQTSRMHPQDSLHFDPNKGVALFASIIRILVSFLIWKYMIQTLRASYDALLVDKENPGTFKGDLATLGCYCFEQYCLMRPDGASCFQCKSMWILI